MEKRWIFAESDEEAITNLQNELKVSRILCDLLVKRGIKTYEDAKNFFRPSLQNLHDPFLMKDMDKAVERLEMAMKGNERILVYGDYDVDGTTAVSLLYGFIKEYYYNVEYYIPDRYTEGYGISFQGIDYAVESGITLIVALDCGIKAIDKVDYASRRGIDFVICDHHRPGDELPKAYAVLDPKREDCTYPYTELTGCGIGFKLVQAFAQKSQIPFEKVRSLLDLVVVSIAADIVPITGENRVLAHFGLIKLNGAPRPGLRSLIELSNAKKPIEISDIVFYIAPRINAAGRMDSGKAAVKLLTSKENSTAVVNADVLDVQNTERREIDKSITEEALIMVRSSDILLDKKSVVLYNPGWHKGVIGIVASRMIENFYKPSIILTDSDDLYAAGSARSVAGFDIYNAIEACSDLLEQFGGHKYAAGLTIRKDNIPQFIDKFEKVVVGSIEEQLLTPEVKVDAELDVRYLTLNFYKIIRQFAPFGPSNLKPIFASRNLQDTGNSSVVGQDDRHLRIEAASADCTIKGIAFNLSPKADLVKNGPFDICYSLSLNEWKGNRSLQLTIKDIKKKQSEPELTPLNGEAASDNPTEEEEGDTIGSVGAASVND